MRKSEKRIDCNEMNLIDRILWKSSGIDNLREISIFRFLIGIIFVTYGFLIFFFIKDAWKRISFALAFWGLGFMFILDGQNVLREYFRQENINK